MRLEYQLTLALVIVFGCCALLLGYDIMLQRRIEQHLKTDKDRIRQKFTQKCHQDSIDALNGRY